MSLLEHGNFLGGVQAYISKHPEVAAYVSDYVARGVLESLQDTRERAADMEVALAVAVAKRYKGRDALLLSKLKKWEGKSALRWDGFIAELEKETKGG